MSKKIHTLRGQVQDGVVKRLVVDDGRLTHGFRITKFMVAGNPTSSANDCFATLGYQGSFPEIWNWSDGNQFAWASSLVSQTGGVLDPFELVDPNHVILRDLYIIGQVGAAGGTEIINYYIEMEAVEVDEYQSVMALIKERSQGELRA
jgi:hypothetical protein